MARESGVVSNCSWLHAYSPRISPQRHEWCDDVQPLPTPLQLLHSCMFYTIKIKTNSWVVNAFPIIVPPVTCSCLGIVIVATNFWLTGHFKTCKPGTGDTKFSHNFPAAKIKLGIMSLFTGRHGTSNMKSFIILHLVQIKYRIKISSVGTNLIKWPQSGRHRQFRFMYSNLYNCVGSTVFHTFYNKDVNSPHKYMIWSCPLPRISTCLLIYLQRFSVNDSCHNILISIME